MRTVRPSPVISRIISSTAWLDSGSRPDVGSSKRSRSGSCRIERAEREAGLHAGREAADVAVEGVLDAEAVGRGPDAVGHLLAPAEAVQLGRVGEVVEPGQAVVERRLRGHDAAAAPHLLAVHVGVEPEDPHRSAVGLERPGDHADGGRLAGAVRSEQHGDRVLGHLEAQPGQGLDLPEVRRTPSTRTSGAGPAGSDRPASGEASSVVIPTHRPKSPRSGAVAVRCRCPTP